MTQGDDNTPRYRVLTASLMLGLAFSSAQAQIPGDAPGGAPQYRDANGVLQPGSGAAGTTNTPSGTWTPAGSSAAAGASTQAPGVSGDGSLTGTMPATPAAAPAVEPSNAGAAATTPRGASAPGSNMSPSNDGAWDVNGSQSNQAPQRWGSPRSSSDADQMPLPSEPTAAGPGSAYGSYDPARESWIPYTSSGYIGVSGGKPDLNTACAAGQTCDDPDSAWSVYLGGQFNPYLGLQVGYLQLQDADRNGGDTKVRGVNIVLTGALPLGSNFSLNGRVGGTYGWTKTSVGAGVAAPSGNEEGFGAAYGVGASWDFDRHWSVTADWDRHHLKYAGDQKKDTDIASIGLRYRF